MTKTGSVSGFKLILLAAALFLAASSRFALADDGANYAAGGIDWRKPSSYPYPSLKRVERLWIRVSLERQRVEIMDGERSVHAMVVSSGLDDPIGDRTPEGTFSIQRERGQLFYSAKAGEGARYWVSWLHHGEYLFHSVPTDKKGNVIESEARKLGSKASHGCIRLTIPDAKWIYENVKFGTKVVIGP